MYYTEFNYECLHVTWRNDASVEWPGATFTSSQMKLVTHMKYNPGIFKHGDRCDIRFFLFFSLFVAISDRDTSHSAYDYARLMWITVEKQCALPVYFFPKQQLYICCCGSVMKGLLQLMFELRRHICTSPTYTGILVDPRLHFFRLLGGSSTRVQPTSKAYPIASSVTFFEFRVPEYRLCETQLASRVRWFPGTRGEWSDPTGSCQPYWFPKRLVGTIRSWPPPPRPQGTRS